MKKGNKITLIILCSILAICVVSIAGVLVWKNIGTKTLVSEEVAIVENGRASAADAAALRELLLKKEEIQITVTEDITVDKTLIVNGKKTLSGKGSIKMALYVVPYEYLVTVADNASLTLDGVTVNGNGIANAIKVEKSANLTFVSGEIAWGNPYGIEVQGKAEIKGGTITDAIHTGVFVGTNGHVEMNAGTIKAAGYASTRISKGGYLCLSGDSILQNCGVYHIHNAGTCDVTGGVVRDSEYTLATTEGDLNIHYQGEDDGMIEWYNATGSGIWVGEGGNLNVSGLYVHDVVYAGVNSGQGTGSIKLTDCKFENIGNNGLHLKMAEVELKNIEIIKPGKHGVFVNSPTTVATIENLTVTEPAERGLHNAGGKVTAKNVTVINPGTYGVSAGNNGDAVGSMVVENLNVTGAGSDLEKTQPAVNCYKSSLVINGATLENSNNAGARVTDGGQLTLKNVKIETAKSYGIYVVHNNSKVTLENVSVANTGKHGVYVNNGGAKADINNLTVTNTGERGIHNNGGTITAKNVTISDTKLYGISTGSHTDSKTKKTTVGSVTIDNLTVTGVQGDAAVNSYKSVLTITNGKITDSAKVGARVTDGGTLNLTDVEITKTGYEGVFVNSEGQAILKNITVTNAGKHGVYVYRANSKANIDTLTVVEPKERGVHNAGGMITAKNVTIKNSGLYGVSTGDYTDKETGVSTSGSVTINSLTVTGAKGDAAVNSYKSVLNITNGKITDAAKVAARVTDAGKLNLTDVEIGATKEGYEGVLVTSKGQATIKNVTVTNAGKHGVYVKDADSIADIDTLKVTEPTERGIHNAGGTITAKNVTITSPGTYGVSTGSLNGSLGSVTVTDLTVTDAGSIEKYPALNSYDSVLTVTDADIKDSNDVGARATDGGEINLNNVEITDAKTHGVYITVGSTATIKGLTVTDCVERGIYVVGGTVTGENVTTNSTGKYGVSAGAHTDDESKQVTRATVNITELTINGTNANSGVMANNSDVTINGGTITGTKTDGAVSAATGDLKMTNVSINSAGRDGVRIEANCTSTLTGVTVIDAAEHGVYAMVGSNAAIKNLTVTDCVERGLYVVGGTVNAETVITNSTGKYGISAGASGSTRATVNITDLTVNGTDANSGVMANKSDVTIIGGTITGTKTDGAVSAATGTLSLTDVSINEAGRNGVQVEKNSTATLTGVEITNAKKHGLYNEGGTVTGENITITTPEIYAVYTVNKDDVKGSVTLTGLSVTGAKVNVPEEDATTVDGAVFANNSTLTITGTETAKKIDGSLKNGAGVINGGILNLNNIEITNAKRHGVYVAVGSTGTANGLTVTDCTERGVYVVGGTFTGTNVTTNSTGKYGISAGASGSTRATVNITGLTVNGTKANSGIMVHNSDVTINGGTITGTKTDGVTAASAGVANLTDVSISNTGRDGVRIEANCTSTLTGVTVIDAAEHGVYAMVGSNAAIKNLTVTDCVERGLYVVGGTVNAETVITNSTGKYGISAGASGSTRATVNITDLTVNGTDANSGVMANKSDVTIIGGTITGTKTDGAVSAATGTLSLTDVSINEAGRNGVQVEKNSTATLTGVEITNAKKHGLYNEGGTVTGENITITTPEIYAVYTVNKDDVKGSVTLTGLSVTGAKVNVPEEDATTVDGAVFANNSTLTITGTETAKKIDGSLKNGAGVINGGILNLNNIEITNAKRHGVYVAVGSTGTANGLTVTDCTERGVYVVGGTFTGTNVTTNSTGKYGISAGASGSTRATVNITGLTVNGTKANSGIMVHNSDVTINGGTITGTKTDGVTAASAGVANLTDVSISNTGRDGVRVEANSTANLTRVTFSNCAAKETYKTATSATINVLE